MRLRRRIDRDRVRHTLRDFPRGELVDVYGEEIVRLRGAIKQAAELLEADLILGLVEARALLQATLEHGTGPRTTATRAERAADPRLGREEVPRKLGR